MRAWMLTAPHPAYGISHARITDKLTRENWLQKAVVRQGPTSIYYTYILAGVNSEEGPWMVEVNGNDVNWEYFPRSDEFSQEFADFDDALRYANGEDDSDFAQSTVPAKRSHWPGERPAQSYTIIEFGPLRRAKKKKQDGRADNGRNQAEAEAAAKLEANKRNLRHANTKNERAKENRLTELLTEIAERLQ